MLMFFPSKKKFILEIKIGSNINYKHYNEFYSEGRYTFPTTVRDQDMNNNEYFLKTISEI